MPTYIAILRGINVSGSKLLKMADLKSALQAMGLDEVETYIQSGNVKFSTSKETPIKLAKDIEQMINETFGYEVPVIVLEKEDLESVTSSNPFLVKGDIDPKALYVTFLGEKPSHEKLRSLNEISSGDDEFKVENKTIFLYCHSGYGRTKLTNNLFEKKLGVTATSRNWKTVMKLLEMAS